MIPDTAIVVYVPRRLNPIIGSRLEITCSVHDKDSATNPNMQVTWFKNNVPIAVENNPNFSFQQNGRKMILRSVSASDQGNYMCAVNDPNVTPVAMYIQPHANGKSTTVYMEIFATDLFSPLLSAFFLFVLAWKFKTEQIQRTQIISL